MTSSSPGGAVAGAPPDDTEGELHRRLAVEANNSTWELLGQAKWSAEQTDDLLARQCGCLPLASRRSGRAGQRLRASWLVSHVHAVLGHGELALHHADRWADVVADAGLADFDLGYAHEARARALACLGRIDEAAAEVTAARAVEIADDEDRSVFVDDLAAGPWYGLSM